MKINVNECVRRLLVHEGGYVNHPNDPGGPTNFGITINDYRKYMKAGATAADVEAMSKMEAVAIYDSKYWDAQKLDDMPNGVDDALFDYGVNSGIGRSGKVIRRVCGLPDNTSAVTIDVLKAAADRDPKQLVHAICHERRLFLRSLHTYPTFGPGWERRVNEVEAYSNQLIVKPPNAIGAKQAPASESPGKAEVKKPKLITKETTSTIAVGGGGGAWTMWDWIAAHPLETTGIVVVGGVVIGFGVNYAAHHWHRMKQEAPMPGTIVVPAAA